MKADVKGGEASCRLVNNNNNNNNNNKDCCNEANKALILLDGRPQKIITREVEKNRAALSGRHGIRALSLFFGEVAWVRVCSPR